MEAEEALRGISSQKPLIHHLTNYVTVNLVANTTLSTGALPVMAHAHEEVVEMVSLASAVSVPPRAVSGGLSIDHLPRTGDGLGRRAVSFVTPLWQPSRMLVSVGQHM